MTFTVQKSSENAQRILIYYSCGHRPTCDGTLCYDKNSQEFSVLTLSSGTSILETEELYPLLKQMIDRGELTGEKQKVAQCPVRP